MATAQGTIDFLLDQLAGLGRTSVRKMFGEYCLYVTGKPVAFICDDQMFLKPTQAGRAIVPEATEAAPYPGAKPYLLIPGDLWEDGEWLCRLLQVTAKELPLPKPGSRKGRLSGYKAQGR